MCHSDFHLWEGGYGGSRIEFIKVEEKEVKFPLASSHEIAGIINELDDCATGLSLRDKVLVYPWIGKIFVQPAELLKRPLMIQHKHLEHIKMEVIPKMSLCLATNTL